jgi:hypothetical protein
MGSDGRGVHYDLASGTFSSGEAGRSEEQIAADFEDAMERMRSAKAVGNQLLAEERYVCSI